MESKRQITTTIKANIYGLVEDSYRKMLKVLKNRNFSQKVKTIQFTEDLFIIMDLSEQDLGEEIVRKITRMRMKVRTGVVMVTIDMKKTNLQYPWTKYSRTSYTK